MIWWTSIWISAIGDLVVFVLRTAVLWRFPHSGFVRFYLFIYWPSLIYDFCFFFGLHLYLFITYHVRVLSRCHNGSAIEVVVQVLRLRSLVVVLPVHFAFGVQEDVVEVAMVIWWRTTRLPLPGAIIPLPILRRASRATGRRTRWRRARWR